MPIYRLGSNGNWRKLSSLYRLGNSGNWRKISAAYRLGSSGVWRRIFGGTAAPVSQSEAELSQSLNASNLVVLSGKVYHWTNSPTSVEYQFQYSTDNGSTWNEFPTLGWQTMTNPSNGSSTTINQTVTQPYVIANILNKYRFRTRATNAGGTSVSTAAYIAQIQGPTNITLTAGTQTRTTIPINWTASTGAQRYAVQYSTNGGISYSEYSFVGTTYETISGLSSGTQYVIRVTPYTATSSTNRGYVGNNSNTVTVTTNVQLSYNANGGSGSVPSTGEFIYGSSVTVSGNTGPLSRTYYTWAGWTLFSDGSGTIYGPGFTSTITMNSDRILYARWLANIPSAPSIGSVSHSPSTTTASSNSLTFSSVSFGSDTQSVLIEWGTTTAYSTGSGSVVTNGGSLTTSSNLSGGTIYYWRARGYNPAYGYGNPITGSYSIPAPPSPPSAPTNLQRSPGSNFTKTFSWGVPSSNGGATITGYEYSVTGSTWAPTSATFSHSFTYSLGGSNSFYVRAVNSAGPGTAASTTFTLPNAGTPTASSITSSSATVSWTSNFQSNYSLSIPGAPSTPYTGTTATSRSITGLSAATTYSPVVTVTSSTGDTFQSNAGSFTTTGGNVAPAGGTYTFNPANPPASGTLTLTITNVSGSPATFTYSYVWARSSTSSISSSYSTQKTTSNSSSNSDTLSLNSLYNNRWVRVQTTVSNGVSPNLTSTQYIFVSNAV